MKKPTDRQWSLFALFLLFLFSMLFLITTGCASSKQSASIYNKNGLIGKKNKDSNSGGYVLYQYTCNSKQAKARKKLKK